MADGRPLWRRAFDGAERTVGTRLEAYVQSEQFADLAALVTRAEVGTRRWVESRTASLWHLLNLPAGSDLSRLSEHVVGLDRQLSVLTETLETLQEEGDQKEGNQKEGNDAAGPTHPRRGAEPGAERRRPRRATGP